jgi:hypothetical protein
MSFRMNIIGVATISICFFTLLVGSARADSQEDIIHPEVSVQVQAPPFQRQEDDYLPVIKIGCICPPSDQENEIAPNNVLEAVAFEHPEQSKHCEKIPDRQSSQTFKSRKM